MAEYVSDEIGEESISIVRDKKKTTATIHHSLTAQTIKEAMVKINFSDCKVKFFGRPLYCRPIRYITPEKQAAVETTPGLVTPTGTKPKEPLKKIPGLPASAQSKALSRKKDREKKEKQEKEKKQKLKEQQEIQMTEANQKSKNKLTAFDVLMQAQQNQELPADPRDKLIPEHCSPAPWKSVFGYMVSDENRRLSFGSSPCLGSRLSKRDLEQMSSPNNSPQDSECKKKMKDSTPN